MYRRGSPRVILGSERGSPRVIKGKHMAEGRVRKLLSTGRFLCRRMSRQGAQKLAKVRLPRLIEGLERHLWKAMAYRGMVNGVIRMVKHVSCWKMADIAQTRWIEHSIVTRNMSGWPQDQPH